MIASEKTSVALFLDASSVGGIEQHVTTLAASLGTSGVVRPTIILWKDYQNETLNQRLLESGVEVTTAGGQFTRLLKLIHDRDIRILHTHGYKANIVGRLVGLLASVRVISTHHNGDVGSGRVRLYTLLDQWSARLSENWSVSREIQQRLAVASCLMPNFISTPIMPTSFGNEVVFVGRLHAVKRPDRFLNVAGHCPEIRFRVIGDGPLYTEVETVKTENVIMHGFEQDSHTIWNNASVCIICSDVEGLPLVALEAMSRGVPVIAWPLGQLPELIESTVNGWIVDNEHACADVVKHWFKLDMNEQEMLRRAARQRVMDSYSAQACLPTYVERYLALGN
jgi:glycosyltransferase involved in cell wall biosynthesis